MTLHQIKTFLAEFDGFDGAVIQSLTVHNTSAQSRQITLVLKAFRSSQGSDGCWKLISIVATDHVIFSWIESPQNTNLVLNYPVEVLAHDDRLIVDLDPLHRAECPLGIKLSSFFIGGCCLSAALHETPDSARSTPRG